MTYMTLLTVTADEFHDFDDFKEYIQMMYVFFLPLIWFLRMVTTGKRTLDVNLSTSVFSPGGLLSLNNISKAVFLC